MSGFCVSQLPLRRSASVVLLGLLLATILPRDCFIRLRRFLYFSAFLLYFNSSLCKCIFSLYRADLFSCTCRWPRDDVPGSWWTSGNSAGRKHFIVADCFCRLLHQALHYHCLTISSAIPVVPLSSTTQPTDMNPIANGFELNRRKFFLCLYWELGPSDQNVKFCTCNHFAADSGICRLPSREQCTASRCIH